MKISISKYWQGKLNRQEMRTLLKELEQKELEIADHSNPSFDLIREKATDSLPYDAELMLASIHLKTNRVKMESTTRIRQLYRWFAAACTLFVVGFLAYYYIGSRSKDDNKLIGEKWGYEQTNHSDQNIELNLPDGSLVSLAPNSRLSYRLEEETHRRMVALDGRAVFAVRKDPSAPFSVASNGFETTALGTKFSVDNKNRKDYVEIHLLEGKVIVKNTKGSRFSIKDTYLKPGDQLKIDVLAQSATLGDLQGKGHEEQSKVRSAGLNAVQENSDGKIDDLNFTQTPLADVFARVGRVRNISIIFSKEDVADLTFTGNLNNVKNIYVLLNGICATNQLTLKYEKDKYTIVKAY